MRGGAGWRAEVGGHSVGKAGGVVGMQGPCFEFRLKLFELVSSIAGLRRALSALGVLRLPPWYPLGSSVASARAFGEAVEFTKLWKGTYEKFQQASNNAAPSSRQDPGAADRLRKALRRFPRIPRYCQFSANLLPQAARARG